MGRGGEVALKKRIEFSGGAYYWQLIDRHGRIICEIDLGADLGAGIVSLHREGIDVDDASIADIKATIAASTLHDYETGDELRAATQQEWEQSLTAAESDGGRGVIEVDGRRCYVA